MSIIPTESVWIVSIGSQSLGLVRGGRVERVYTVSTSKNPPSCTADSFGTPLGLHVAADKIGSGAPLGTVFKGRVSMGKPYEAFSPEEQKRSLITTRIVRLRGLEPGKNSGPGCDTYERYIYFHGTNHEARIGTPASCGCVQLRNQEMVEFHEQIQPGDLVWITAR